MIRHLYITFSSLATIAAISAQLFAEDAGKSFSASDADSFKYPQTPIVNVVLIVQGAEKTIAQDMKAMESSGACNMHAISFTLHPESEPKPFDKMKNYAPIYKKIVAEYDALGARNAKVGALVQSIMGHWIMNKPSKFQKIVSAQTGEQLHTYCPLDADFLQYAKDCAAKVAALNPDFAMIDDDTRLITGRNACACPLHLKSLSKKLGYDISKENLMKALQSTAPADKAVGRAFDEVLGESMYGLMRNLRAGFDSVNPKLPVIYCQCSEDARFSPEISKILAGEGNQTMCRINNAIYWNGGERTRAFPFNVYRTAIQTDICKDIDILLAETDPYPHNKYFTGARILHALLSESILEGCSGAKFWPNGGGVWDGEAGVDYKRIFAEYSKFYQTLVKESKDFKPFGVTSPIPENRILNWNPVRSVRAPKWNAVVFGRMGFAHNCAKVENADIFALDSGIVAELSDAELKTVLSKNAILDASAAIAIEKRGLADMLGMKVVAVSPTTAIEDLESTPINGAMSGLRVPSARAFEILPQKQATILSRYSVYDDCSSPIGRKEGVAAAAFENPAGGKVVVFAANVSDAKNMMTSSRKRMFEGIFNWLGGFPITYSADAEIFLRAGKTGDGAILAQFINLGLDPVSELKITLPSGAKKISKLTPDGKWIDVDFKNVGDKYEVNAQCQTMMPLVLKIYSK